MSFLLEKAKKIEEQTRLQEMNDTQLLIKLHERLSAIETHLGDMNGKLVTNTKRLEDDCPRKHDRLEKRFTALENKINDINLDINKMLWKISIVSAGLAFIATIIGTRLVNFFMNLK